MLKGAPELELELELEAEDVEEMELDLDVLAEGLGRSEHAEDVDVRANVYDIVAGVGTDIERFLGWNCSEQYLWNLCRQVLNPACERHSLQGIMYGYVHDPLRYYRLASDDLPRRCPVHEHDQITYTRVTPLLILHPSWCFPKRGMRAARQTRSCELYGSESLAHHPIGLAANALVTSEPTKHKERSQRPSAMRGKVLTCQPYKRLGQDDLSPRRCVARQLSCS